MDEPKPSKLLKTIQWVPGINTLYYLVFHTKNVHIDDIQDFLNSMILTAALLLAVAASLLGTVSYDEIIAAETRWHFGGIYGCVCGYGCDTSTLGIEFSKKISSPIMSLSIALVVMMFIYLNISTLTNDKSESKEQNLKSTRLVNSWWGYMRFLVVGVLLLLSIGVVFMFDVYRNLLNIKFPHPGIETFCGPFNETSASYVEHPGIYEPIERPSLDWNDPYREWEQWEIVFGVVFAFAFLFQGFVTKRVHDKAS